MLSLPTIQKSRNRLIKLTPRPRIESKRWVWPLPALDDAKPVIVAFANDTRKAVDVGYDDASMAGVLVPVYAVQDGMLQLARETASGFALVLNHHGAWSSYYGRLPRMICSPTWDDARPTMRVRAGQLIGYTSGDAPIRFELWRWTADAGFVPTSPAPHMSEWRVLREHVHHKSNNPSTSPTTKVAA